MGTVMISPRNSKTARTPEGEMAALRIEVVAAAGRLRNLLGRVVLAAINPDARVRAAAVVFPLLGAVGERRIGDVCAVGRVARFDAVGNRQLRRHATAEGHGEELRV